MVDIGVHPTDETGVKRILIYEMSDLFKNYNMNPFTGMMILISLKVRGQK